MNSENVRSVYEIEKLCFDDPWKLSIFENQLQESYSRCFVAYIDERAAGYVMLWCFDDEGEIINIATHPDFRRKGIADALLAACMDICKKIVLDVRASNLAAQRLYAKHGFKDIGTRLNYYDKPKEDAIIMRLEE